MKKIYMLCLCFSLIFLKSFGQGKDLADSLQHVLTVTNIHDSARVNTLITLANVITHANPDSAKKYAEEGLAISQEIKWQRGVARSYRQLGYIFYTQADYPTAVDYDLKALKAAESLQDKKFMGSMFNNLALVYTELSELEKALMNYEKFLLITRELKLHEQEAIALMNIGLVYSKKK